MFATLRELLRHDEDKVRRMLGIFARVTRTDLESMDAAFARSDRAEIGALAHRMKSACYQIGEETAGQALAALEELATRSAGEPFARGFQKARENLVNVLEKIEQYLASTPGDRSC